jgi:hypothetical protein
VFRSKCLLQPRLEHAPKILLIVACVAFLESRPSTLSIASQIRKPPAIAMDTPIALGNNAGIRAAFAAEMRAGSEGRFEG